MSKIASIVVNYNSGSLLMECVTALLAAELDPTIEHTIHVVDNASTDRSVAVLEENVASGKVHVVRNPTNVGFSAANNQILSKHEADYYVLVNPDCTVERDTIAQIIAVMDGDPQMALASCLIFNSDGSIQKTCKREFPTPASGLVRMFGLSRLDPDKFRDFDQGLVLDVPPAASSEVEYVPAISGAFFCIGNTALQKIGLLDEGYFMHCEDLDYCMRAKMAGYKVGFVPWVSVVHHKGASSSAAPLKVLWHLHKGMGRFYGKFYKNSYPAVVNWLVYIGIGVRFAGKALKIFLNRLFASPRTASS